MEIESEEGFRANEALHERGELVIRGSGGGGGKGKGGGSGTDADNTLRSKARARMIEAISEGEIEGLVNGEQSIFFEQTPLRNEDGSYNFKNVIWREHKGLPDEGHFPGHAGVETPSSVEVQVKAATGPVQRTIVDANADAIRVILRIPALFEQDKKKGETKTASLSYRIDVRAHQGIWTTAIQKNVTNEKCTSPYQIAHRVELPLDGSPWDIRVMRLTPDSDKIELQNDLWWEGYVTIVDGKFIYPHTAAVGLEVNGEDMGQSIPARSFHVKGLKVLVPSNYNPITRAYTGIWNGTFKRAWTNNPAWIFYDLIINDRYGLGEFIRPEIVDKWSLYTIAQYCDQEVPSGYRNGDTGEMIMEPRFTYNGVINNREEAYHVLQAVTAAWRGMAYWSLGQVFATADIPADPVKVVTPANVLGGEFNYSGTAMKARHSVCIIRWNDPGDFYRPATEIVINDAMLRRYGWREKSVTFDGCTSRGLAHRYGKWILDVEQNENETVEYNASWDHAEVRPGDIVAIADPAKALVRAGGRVVSFDVATKTVKLDAPFEATPGETYSLMVALPNGKLDTRAVVSWVSSSEAVLQSAFSEEVQPDAMYAVTGTDIRPRQFRVLSVREEEKNVFKVTALFHDPLKYARVEQNIKFDPLPYTRPKDVSYPPENLQVREVYYQLNGVQRSRMLFSWSPNPNSISRFYHVKIITPFDGEIDFGETERTWVELNDVTPGPYIFVVRAIGISKKPSDWVEFEYEAVGPAGMPIPTVTNIRLADRPGNEFVGRDVRVIWDNNFAGTSDPTAEEGSLSPEWSPFFKSNTVKVYDTATSTLLRTQNTAAPLFTYSFEMNKADSLAAGFATARRSLRFEIVVSDTFGRTSLSGNGVFQNLPPAAVVPTSYISGDKIFLAFPHLDDPDFVGHLIWFDTIGGYNPATTPSWGDTPDTNVVVPAEPTTTYYFRFAAYDAFGKDGLNYSPEIQIVTGLNGFDFDAPAAPAKPTLTSALENDEAKLVAQWTANTENDLAGYDVEIREGSGAWVSFLTTSNRYEWSVKAGVTYTVRLRAYDASGNKSAVSVSTTHTAIKDTTPPAAPTGFTVTAGLTSFWLEWTNPADADLDYIEVLEGTTNIAANAVVVGRALGTSFARTGLANQVARFFWLRAVDTSGNKSALTAAQTATTAALPDAKRITITGLTLTPNSPSGNRVAWTAFTVGIGSPTAGTTSANVTAGNVAWTSGSLYLYYVEGETTLRSTTSIATIYTNNGYPVAVYRGGTDVQMADGKVVMDGNNILAGTVGASQLVVNEAIITSTLQLKDAIITSAKIASIKADQIEANGVLASTIQVGSDSLGTIKDRAADPAARINQGTTIIDPGKILISGASRLSNWISGSDATKIDGGALAANSLKGNTAVIGMRGITVDGITFEHNSPSANRVSWTAGTIAYTDDAGASVTRAITASNILWSAGTLYLYWVKGATTISSTTSFATANGDNNVILATYKGGIWLFASYGRTIIDGGQLKSQSIDTEQLKVGAVKAGNIDVTTLSAITADVGVMTAGLLRSSDSMMQIDLNNKRVLIADNT